MTSPRFGRRRSPAAAAGGSAHAVTVEHVLKAIGFLLLTVVGIIIFTSKAESHATTTGGTIDDSKNDYNNNNPRSRTGRQLEESDYPGSFIDLWPDDRNTENYRKSLLNCIPGFQYDDKDTTTKTTQHHSCQVRPISSWSSSSINGDKEEQTLRVALVRPPGQLGDVFVEYMNLFLLHTTNLPADTQQQQQQQQQQNNQPPIELVPTSIVIGAKHNYSMIVRLATLPVLLEATDLALSLNATGKINLTNDNNFTLKDLMDLVRYTIRWQCHITERIQDTALLTITMDRMIGYPTSTSKKLQKFLGIATTTTTTTTTKKKNRALNLKVLPLVVMDRINAGSALVQSIGVPTPKLLQVMTQVVEEEVKASQQEDSCRSIINIIDGIGDN